MARPGRELRPGERDPAAAGSFTGRIGLRKPSQAARSRGCAADPHPEPLPPCRSVPPPPHGRHYRAGRRSALPPLAAARRRRGRYPEPGPPPPRRTNFHFRCGSGAGRTERRWRSPARPSAAPLALRSLDPDGRCSGSPLGGAPRVSSPSSRRSSPAGAGRAAAGRDRPLSPRSPATVSPACGVPSFTEGGEPRSGPAVPRGAWAGAGRGPRRRCRGAPRGARRGEDEGDSRGAAPRCCPAPHRGLGRAARVADPGAAQQRAPACQRRGELARQARRVGGRCKRDPRPSPCLCAGGGRAGAGRGAWAAPPRAGSGVLPCPSPRLRLCSSGRGLRWLGRVRARGGCGSSLLPGGSVRQRASALPTTKSDVRRSRGLAGGTEPLPNGDGLPAAWSGPCGQPRDSCQLAVSCLCARGRRPSAVPLLGALRSGV